MSLVVFSALEQIPLDLIIYLRERVAVKVLLELSQILVLNLYIYEIVLVKSVLPIGRQSM